MKLGKIYHRDIVHGDMLDVLPEQPQRFDSCVTDPPYGLKFMGKGWDHGVPGVPYWEQINNVLKPGAFLLAFGGTRTHHRLFCAIEDAGFELTDVLMWLHGEGFPKGSNLKPAWEPILLARKQGPPMKLNIADNRIGIATGDSIYGKNPHTKGGFGHAGAEVYGDSKGADAYDVSKGRHPANLILQHHDDCTQVGTRRVKTGTTNSRKGTGSFAFGDHDKKTNPWVGEDGKEEVADWECHPDCPIRLLDEQTGDLPGPWGKGQSKSITKSGLHASSERPIDNAKFHGESGGASRFFYQAKASPKERFFACRTCDTVDNDRKEHKDHDTIRHPTQKPVGLIRHLVRLVTPPGGYVLDPFVGSGTLGVAAKAEGMNYLGIDQDPDYCRIARYRGRLK